MNKVVFPFSENRERYEARILPPSSSEQSRDMGNSNILKE